VSPESFALVAVIVFVGFLVRGFSGFGSILFTLPLVVLWLPVRVAVPLLSVLSLANGGWLAWRARVLVDRAEFRRLTLGGLPGVAVGVLLFQYASDGTLRRALGVAVVLLGIWLLTQRQAMGKPWPPAAGVGAGAASGVLGGLFGLSGPPPVLYLARRPLDADRYRATLLVFLLAVDLLRGASYLASGEMTGALWLVGLGLFPASLAGSWYGERLQGTVSDERFRKITGVLLALMGVVLVLTTRN
jgi:uncharacterized membrane protein YfcA